MGKYVNIITVEFSMFNIKNILIDYGVLPNSTNFVMKASAVKKRWKQILSFKESNTKVPPK